MTQSITPFTHPRVVLAHLHALHTILVPSLGYCCDRSTAYFREQNLDFDAGLHSYLTRHRLLHILRRKSISAVEEIDRADYTTEGQSLCGIRVETDHCVIKLLKYASSKKELPAVTTDHRKDFYQANLGFDTASEAHPQKLNILSFWSTDPKHRLRSFAVACPFGGSDRRPRKKWWQTLEISAFGVFEIADLSPIELDVPEPELNEITPKLQAIEPPQNLNAEPRPDEKLRDEQSEGDNAEAR